MQILDINKKMNLSLRKEVIFINKYNSIITRVVCNLFSKEIVLYIKFLKYAKDALNSLNSILIFSSDNGSSLISLLLKYKINLDIFSYLFLLSLNNCASIIEKIRYIKNK